MTDSSFRLTFSSTNLRPRVAITLELTGEHESEAVMRVQLSDLCTPGMGVSLWGISPR